MSVLRTEWTSNAAGHGAGSLSHAALQAPVTDLHDVPAPAPADAHTASSWAPSAAASAAAAQADEHVDEDHGGDGIDEDDGDDDFVPLPAKQQQQQRGGARPMSALAVPSTSSAVSGAPGNGGSEPVSPYPQQHPQRPFSSSYLTASTGSLSRTGTLERPTTARPASRSGAPQVREAGRSLPLASCEPPCAGVLSLHSVRRNSCVCVRRTHLCCPSRHPPSSSSACRWRSTPAVRRASRA